jgi:hypothetical protein
MLAHQIQTGESDIQRIIVKTQRQFKGVIDKIRSDDNVFIILEDRDEIVLHFGNVSVRKIHIDIKTNCIEDIKLSEGYFFTCFVY